MRLIVWGAPRRKILSTTIEENATKYLGLNGLRTVTARTTPDRWVTCTALNEAGEEYASMEGPIESGVQMIYEIGSVYAITVVIDE